MSQYVGLSYAQAATQLAEYGENRLPEKKKLSSLSHFMSQFTSPLIYVLVTAGVVTYLLGDYTDALVIFMAVFINTMLGYYQEAKAEHALRALKNILEPVAKVYRGDQIKKIPLNFIVPDDVVLLHQGDKIPADGVLLEVAQLSVNESMLTGESVAVGKRRGDVVYMGTAVLTGRALFKVTETGIRAKMGVIAENLFTTKEAETPLQQRLNRLARLLAGGILFITLIVMITGIARGIAFRQMFITSVALAVAAIPEGLTISLTVILSLGMQRILKKKALVRKLLAAETLGSITVIATDKTGTLTEGIMRVTDTHIDNMQDALNVACFANNLDDPIEFALWEWVSEHDIDPEEKNKTIKRQREVPFDSIKRYMSVTVDSVIYAKGAPEIIMSFCRLSQDKKNEILEQVHVWSKKGLRVIAFSKKEKTHTYHTWIGLAALQDPVRKGLDKVFNDCAKAGIRVIMMTGDHAGTAEAVWRAIYGDKTAATVIVGEELEKMSDKELLTRINHVDIFARVSPMQKLRLIQTLQRKQEIVALIGDGVNDALALKASHLGVVVGEATDVAKETADMVLLDSNFKTIVQAIHEGRGIFDNIQKVILYLLSDSLSQIIPVIGTLLLGLPIALTASQILWVNIITDSLPALSLTFEPHTVSRARTSPRVHNALFDGRMIFLTTSISTVMGLIGLLLYIHIYNTNGLEVARSTMFGFAAFSTLFIIFSVRTLFEPMWHTSLFKNPFLIGAVVLGSLLQLIAIHFTIPLSTYEWFLILGAVSVVMLLTEVLKMMIRYYSLNPRLDIR